MLAVFGCFCVSFRLLLMVGQILEYPRHADMSCVFWAAACWPGARSKTANFEKLQRTKHHYRPNLCWPLICVFSAVFNGGADAGMFKTHRAAVHILLYASGHRFSARSQTQNSKCQKQRPNRSIIDVL